MSNRKTLSNVSGDWERGRDGTKRSVLPREGLGNQSPVFGGAQWSSLTPPQLWNGLVAKRAGTWPQEWAGAGDHLPHLSHTSA